MRVLGTKAAISALALAALLTTPAFAAKRHQVSRDPGFAGYYDATAIPGYDSQGNVVGVPNPDQYSAESQR
jgi:hypothetical protein